MDGQYLPDDELDIDSLASSEPPEFVPQMFSEGGEVEDRDIEYYANGGEASVQSMNEYLLSDEEDAAPEMAQSASYGGESAPEMNLETARSMMRKLAAKGAGKSSRSKEMSMELSGLVPAIPDLGAPQTEQEKLTQIATARAQYDALEEAYKLKAQAAQRAGRGLTRATFSGSTFNQPTLEKAGPLMARTFAKGGAVKALKGTKAVDEAGKPVLAYRGEYGPSSGLSTQQGSLSYGTKEAANLYATRPNTGAAVQASKVFPSYLSIRKPLVNTPGDPFIDLSVLRNALGEKEFDRVIKKNAGYVEGTNAFEELAAAKGYTSVLDLMKKNPKDLDNLYMEIFPVLDDAKAVKAMQRKGYDGAIYGGSGATANEPEYRVFGASQAVSPYGMQPMAPRTAKQQFSDIVRGMDISPTDALELFGRAGSAAAMALTPSTLNEGEEEELARRRAMPPTITPPAKPYKEGGEADKKDQGPAMTGINRVTDFIAQRLPASSFPTSGRTLLETVQGKRDPITEGNFSPEELAVMKEMIALKGGDAGDIQYGDYQALAKVMRARGKIPASTTPSLFSMSDSLGNVQTTLGRFKYGRDDKGNLVVRDTYDFNPPQDPNSLQEQRTAEYGAMGPYSLIREYAGEKIPPGRGREININLGKPVKRAEGSPASGERLTPQQIERLAAEQAALNTYQPVMNRNIQRQGERSRNLASQRDVSTLPDPQTYAFIESALFGTPPDEVANKFGVFHPRRKDILSRAEQGFVTGNVAMVAPAARMLKDVTAPAVKYLGKEAARQVERGIFNEGPLRAITPQPMYISRPPGGYFPTSRGMAEKTAEEINNTKLSDLPEEFVTWLNTDDKQKASFLGLGPKKESLGDKYNRWKTETGSKDYTFGVLSNVDMSLQPVLKKITELEPGEKRDALFQMFNQKAKDFYSKQAGSVQDPLRTDILSGKFKFDEKSQMGDVFPQVLVKQAAQGNLQALRLLEKEYDRMFGIEAVIPYRAGQPAPFAGTLKSQIIESVRDNLNTIPDNQLLAYAGKKPLPGPNGVAEAAKEVRQKLKENPNLFSTVLEPNIERTIFAREETAPDLRMARYPGLYGSTATKSLISPQGAAYTAEELGKIDTLPRGYYLPEMETAIDKSQPILDTQNRNLKLLGLDAETLLQEANKLSAKDLNSMGFTDFLKKAYTSSQEVEQLEKDIGRVKSLLQQGKTPPAKAMLFGVKDFVPTVNDMRWVKVTDPNGVKSIAAGMNNSVGSYATSNTYGTLDRGRRALDSGEVEIYALYDKNHVPHVTVEYGTGKSSVPEKFKNRVLQLTGNGPLTGNDSPKDYAEQIATLVNALPIKDVTSLPATTQKILRDNFFEFKDGKYVKGEELGLAKGGSVDKNTAFIKANT